MLKRIGCSTLSYLLKIPKPSLLLRAQNPTFFFAQVQVPNQLLQTVN
jgi:predicted alpha/beta-fold hydrolase